MSLGRRAPSGPIPMRKVFVRQMVIRHDAERSAQRRIGLSEAEVADPDGITRSLSIDYGRQ